MSIVMTSSLRYLYSEMQGSNAITQLFASFLIDLHTHICWNIISKFLDKRNGRVAYKSYKYYFQDCSYLNLVTSRFTTIMIKTFYNGDMIKLA